MNFVKAGAPIILAGLMAACASQTQGEHAGAEDKVFETNITNNAYLSSGEPEIAVDPKNPRHLAVIEFSMGAGVPGAAAPTANPPGPSEDPAVVAQSAHVGRVMLSDDGGTHWAIQPGKPPATDPKSKVNGGGDPMIAFGPDGTLYAADETPPPSTGEGGREEGSSRGSPRELQALLAQFSVMIAASRDGGRTFAAPQNAGTPADRPWLVVDQTTGTVYTVSSGALNVTTGAHNVAGPDAPNDRWLVAWQPHLAGKSAPHRIGGPDFSGSGGNTISAAHGVIAATFVLGGPAPGGGVPSASAPVPASLRDLMKGGVTTCSMQAPCLFFETSTDQGEHWVRHHVVVPGGFSGQRVNVSADPGRAGRYALSALVPDKSKFLVLVTDDSGATWSQPASVPEAAAGVDFKQWMAYGPSGVLGLTWRKERLDLTPTTKPDGAPQNPLFPSTGPAYDIYAAVSCDGGATWPAPVRINADPSPPGPPGRDDLGYIALDGRYAHVVWGDHRMVVPGKKPPADHTIQAYYGRVPFSVLSHGARCGRG